MPTSDPVDYSHAVIITGGFGRLRIVVGIGHARFPSSAATAATTA